MFREGCEDSEYDPRSGQPSTARNLGTVAKVRMSGQTPSHNSKGNESSTSH